MQSSTYDPVKISFEGKTQEHYGVCHSVCYPERFWAPVGGFLSAVYDDCGDVKLNTDPATKTRLLQFLQEALQGIPVVHAGENPSHDMPLDLPAFMAESAPDLFAFFTDETKTAPPADSEVLYAQGLICWNKLMELGHEHRLFWLQFGAIPRALSFAIMHQEAYLELIALVESRKDRAGASLQMRSYFDSALASGEAYRQEMLAKNEAGDVNAPTPDSHDFMVGMRVSDELRRMGSHEGSRYPSESRHMGRLISKFFKKELTEDQLFARIVPYLQDRYALSSLSSLNLHFEPMVYAQQDYENCIGRDYSQFVGKVSAKVSHARMVQTYGEMHTYMVEVTDPQVFKPFSRYVRGCDAIIMLELVQVSATSGRQILQVSCSLSHQDLLDAISQFHREATVPGQILGETLQMIAVP